MPSEQVTLEPFRSESFDVQPERHREDDPCPHYMPNHLKEGFDAVHHGKRLIVYAYNNGSPWYMFETISVGDEWSQPGDGQFIGSTLRMIKDRFGCDNDADCICRVLAEKQIPLMPHAVISEEDKPIALSLLLEPDFTRFITS